MTHDHDHQHEHHDHERPHDHHEHNHQHDHHHDHDHHEHNHDTASESPSSCAKSQDPHDHDNCDHEHHDHELYTVDGITPAIVSIFRDIDAQTAEELSAKYRPLIAELTDKIKANGWTIGHIKLQAGTIGGSNFFISSTSPESISERVVAETKSKLGLTVIAIGPTEEELKEIIDNSSLRGA
jgi:hypothetical protein